jgi:hypothetical protein
MSDQDWQNQNKIDVRTKVALKMLMFMFKVLSPYRFEHQFKKDIDEIEKSIKEL